MATYLEFKSKNESIEFFIKYFKHFDNNNILERTFLYGYCYYFAIILKERFNGDILYDINEGHFLTKIDDCLYDIRGNVTKKYLNINLIPYEELEKLNDFSNIKCGCIDKYIK